MERRLDDDGRQRIGVITGGGDLKTLSNTLLQAIDADAIEKEVEAQAGAKPTEDQRKEIESAFIDEACKPFNDPALRNLLVDLKQKSEIVIDEITTDKVTSAGYDMNQAEARITSFENFIKENKDQLLALQILYSRPQARRKLTYTAIKELAQRLSDPPHFLTTPDVWQAYKRLNASVVRGAPSDKMLTDIIALVRFATGQTDILEPYMVRVEQRFNLWIGRQKKAGIEFTEDQMVWLKVIKDHLGANVEIEPRDLIQYPAFTDRGGLLEARRIFPMGVEIILNDLRGVLAA